mmetsp:Transcript_29237/g.75699  ORF Transcript_29237/g.75699 Transcript_29237/m.75699 type:complete len:382 (-) Transcript_29237:605-1750(-)
MCARPSGIRGSTACGASRVIDGPEAEPLSTLLPPCCVLACSMSAAPLCSKRKHASRLRTRLCRKPSRPSSPSPSSAPTATWIAVAVRRAARTPLLSPACSVRGRLRTRRSAILAALPPAGEEPAGPLLREVFSHDDALPETAAASSCESVNTTSSSGSTASGSAGPQLPRRRLAASASASRTVVEGWLHSPGSAIASMRLTLAPVSASQAALHSTLNLDPAAGGTCSGAAPPALASGATASGSSGCCSDSARARRRSAPSAVSALPLLTDPASSVAAGPALEPSSTTTRASASAPSALAVVVPPEAAPVRAASCPCFKPAACSARTRPVTMPGRKKASPSASPTAAIRLRRHWRACARTARLPTAAAATSASATLIREETR